MDKVKAYIQLSELFKKNGYSLFLVGGTVRDILLNIELTDMDVVTDATPIEMKKFIDGDYTFSSVGSVRYKIDDVKFDITTLRKEGRYIDHRHPNKITFVRDLKTDHKRRDFTINAMYMDSNFYLYDYENGEEDLNNKILKMVGNPIKRLKEDPLRIIRCLRFSLLYDLQIDRKLDKAIYKCLKYLKNINAEKIKMELKKIDNKYDERLIELLDKYSINYFIDVLE